METKYLILGITLSVLFATLFFIEGIESKNELNETYCENIETPSLNNLCLAIITKDFGRCTGKYYEIDLCYRDVLLVTENLSEQVCNGIYKTYPREDCYFILANRKENASYCEKTGMREDECHLQTAIILKNSEICNLIFDPDLRYLCLAQITLLPGYCENISEEYETTLCKAVVTKDLAYCKKESSEETYSEEICLYELAISSKDYAICSEIKSPELKISCMVTLGNPNENLCYELEEPYKKDNCLLEILKIKLSI